MNSKSNLVAHYADVRKRLQGAPKITNIAKIPPAPATVPRLPREKRKRLRSTPFTRDQVLTALKVGIATWRTSTRAWAKEEYQADEILHLVALVLPTRKFALGDRVRKTKGSSWQGRVVGFYATDLTPLGYAVESEREPGSVQIYPENALETVE